ncbi:MAG: hypothetical protein ACHQJ6_07460, partial [Candidatus Berkiellales bacterium]
ASQRARAESQGARRPLPQIPPRPLPTPPPGAERRPSAPPPVQRSPLTPRAENIGRQPPLTFSPPKQPVGSPSDVELKKASQTSEKKEQKEPEKKEPKGP